MKKLIAGVLIIIACAAAAACTKGSDSAVIAKVNRAKITSGDFKRQLQELPPQMQQAVATDQKSRKDFLQDLIGIEVVLQEAKRLGLHKDPELKKRQETLKKELQRRIDEEFKNELFNALLKKELADKVPTPTDADVKKYYEAHRKEMRTADGRTLSYQEAAPQLKNWLFQQKQRELYLDYANKLKEKAKVSIDEKALEAAATSPASTSPHGLQLEGPPAAGPGK